MKNLFLVIGFSLFCGNVLTQTFVDPNFTAIPIGSGWNSPVGAIFSKNGQKLFVWERSGKLYVCHRDGSGNYIKQTQPVADLTEEVGDADAHGMLGFTLDPAFDTNGLIYLLYVVDRHHLFNFGTPSYDPNITITGQATIGRLTRYQTITSNGNLVINPSTRYILIGESKTTGMPVIHRSHGVGALAFAADGTLLVTMGDGASFEGIDGGSDPGTYYQQALADGIIRLAENVGAFRAQMINSMNGKLLRIDPQTGNGVPSNPFYSAAQPRAPKSRVWALGLRNAFRIFIKPGTGSTDPLIGDIGEVHIGDVSFASWEEMDICKAPGTNFGWPIYEGNEFTIPLDSATGVTYKDLNVANQDEPNPLYGTGGCTQQYFYFRQLIKQATADDNKTIYNPCNSSVVLGSGNRYYHRRPALEWSHAHPWARVGIFNGNTADVAMIGSPESQVIGTPFSGQCSIGGIVYTGNNFPAQYKNSYLQADFVNSWIKRITVDFVDQVTRVDDFASDFSEIVCITENPLDGTLVTVQLGSSTGVRKIQYGGNQPPVAKLSANKTYGPSPLTVNFTGGNSFDPTPGGSIASYSWNFGGGSPATSNVANPANIVFTESSGTPKKFVVKLTVTDNGGATHSDSIIVSVNNTPPVVNITSPVKNSLYKQGPDTLYACTATVTDAQHSPSQLKYEWQTTLRHNNHEHREAIDNAVNTNALIQRVGFYGSDVYYWLIELKVTDAAGLSTKDSAKIFPDRSAGSDVTPPLVSSVSPLGGTSGVAINAPVIATFNEAIDASTVNGTTFQLKAGSTTISATVTTLNNQITLRPSVALNGSTVYTATIKGGLSGIKDLAHNALATDFIWNFTTGVVDNTPPAVATVSPVNGASGVSTGISVTANFSETINGATVTGGTFQLKNSSGSVIAATINTSGNQISLTPSAALANSSTYTVTITGGASGVKDLAGNALTANYTWTFTTAATTYSIFQTTANPAEPLNNDGQGIVVGMKFRSSLNGYITGVRYYKGTGSTGIHTGHLWTGTGSLLGSATFSGETASGWQQTLLANPIAINANTTYVVSLFSSSGYYAFTNLYFNQAVVNSPLRALANGEDGPNGLYSYSSTSVFPVSSFNASNYWVDVVFTTSGPATAPAITIQPSSQTRCAGTTASFTSVATGTPAPTVQWQVTSDGISWANVTGATNTTLSFVTTIADNNKRYRAVWTNSAGSAVSNAATLTVNAAIPTPTVTVTNNCGSSVLTATGFTGSLLWSNGATTPSITVATAGTYTVKQTVGGCTSAAGTGIASPKALPVLSSSLSVTVTSGIAFSYIATSSTAGTAFTWSRAAVPGISNAAANGTGNANETLINTIASPVKVTYVYTLTANGCTNTQNVVVTVSPVTYSIFPTTTVPAQPSNNDGQGIVVGMKFRSSLNGYITGVRYFKGAGTTGTHTGHLWTSTGSLRGSSTFSGETASGWQQTLFAAPIAINANTTYLVSLFSSSGDYTSTNLYFTQAVVNSPLRALADGEDGPNGLYSYSSTSVFPNSSFNASNYWVDVVFTTSGPGTAPAITTQPSSQTRCAGTTASFTSVATGTPAPTVLWQVSSDGIRWGNVVGATNTTLSFVTTIADNNKRYRAVWTNSAGAAVSIAATLTVNAATPTVTVTNNCGSSVLTATGFTGSLLWSNGATTPSITVATAGTYTVKQTVGGCTSSVGTGVASPKVIPVLSSGLSATATSGTAFSYIATSSTAGTAFTWSRAAVPGISNAAANGTGNVNETLINTTGSPLNVIYVYTLTANGCTNTQNVVVTVNPSNTGQRSPLQPVVKQAPILSVEELLNGKLEVNAIPNPSNTFFNLIFKSNNKNPATVRVTDIFGREVERYEKISSSRVQRIGNRLTTGIYFVEVIQDKQRRFIKIIKAN